jgi:hypothetical protein
MLIFICGQVGQNMARPPSMGLLGRLWPEFDCKDHATPLKHRVALYTGPESDGKDNVIIQWIGIFTGTHDGKVSFVIHLILLIKFIATVLHFSASSQK